MEYPYPHQSTSFHLMFKFFKQHRCQGNAVNMKIKTNNSKRQTFGVLVKQLPSGHKKLMSFCQTTKH